ncbi:EI24 domain-containing protein [Erythrobacter sp.]|jgi:uncharacterized protein involved in cysteine biosynthesis|uniref:EI24 domain-containing protein n=1 Tax=Erythrobacter sp. TaxID=1042 RepID=UPI002EB4B002|nr:EI24 domain-containing protein [Erythrobacter sp.]
MTATLSALAKAIGQLADRAVLAVLLKSLGITVFVFVGLGAGLFVALRALFESYGLVGGGLAGAAGAALLAILAFWLLFRVVALAVLQFFAEDIVIAVERRHYPDRVDTARAIGLGEEARNALRSFARTVAVNLIALPPALALIVTGIGAALVFFAANAWLLGRELTDMAWLRHRTERAAGSPVPRHQRLTLGLAVGAMMIVPFVGLLAPVVGAAAGTHLAHRALGRQGEGGAS